MKLSRERKVYVAVLTIGVGVLGADRFFGGPSPANASTSPGSPGGSTEKSSASTKASAGTAHVQRVALHEYLERMAAEASEQNAAIAFTIDPAWRAELAPKEPAASVATDDQASPTPTVAPSFLPKVTMIVEDASGGFAVMDGQAVRVGERSKEGALLVHLAKGVAVVQIDGVEHTIKVNQEPAPKPR